MPSHARPKMANAKVPMAGIKPVDPRPGQAHPQHRAERKELEKKHPAFGWKEGLILGLLGVTVFMNIEKDVEKKERRHREREERGRRDRDRDREGQQRRNSRRRIEDWDDGSEYRGGGELRRRRSWDGARSRDSSCDGRRGGGGGGGGCCWGEAYGNHLDYERERRRSAYYER